MDDAGVNDIASARRALMNLKKNDMKLYKYAISFKCKFVDLLSNLYFFPHLLIITKSPTKLYPQV